MAQPVAIALNDHPHLGQVFTAEEKFNLLWVSVPSWSNNEGGFTLTLWGSPRRRLRLASRTFTDIRDNSRVALILPEPVPPGTYYWEVSQRTGSTRVGLYAHRLESDSLQPAYLGDQHDFTHAGIDIFHPHYNLADGWREDGKHDWSGFVNLLSHLLGINRKAYFLIRLGVFAPEWWKAKHPQELVGYACELDEQQGEFGGVRHPSFASEVWRRDTEAVLRHFLRFVERSPLRSRVIGYQIANGIYGEWHYFGARYLPDTSLPMQRA